MSGNKTINSHCFDGILCGKRFPLEKIIFILLLNAVMNKALAGCIYNMNSIGDVQAKAVFDELKKDGFKKLGIEGKKRGIFYNYNKNNYKIYREISMSDFDEFMIKNGSRMEKETIFTKQVSFR